MKNKYFGFIIGLVGIVFSFSSQAFFEFADQDQIPRWAQNAVESVREADIMTGFGDGTFGPYQTLNRAEALAILLRTKGIDYKTREVPSGFPFRDVEAGAWYAKIIENGVYEGWVKGFPDGTFQPGKSVNRAEWAMMIRRAFDLTQTEDPQYRDVPQEAWFAPAVFNLVANDLVRYITPEFGPDQPVSRAEAAWMIGEILEKPRLMGTSAENDFSLAQKRDARRTAIKPRDFNPNLQGYESDRKAINIHTDFPEEEELNLTRESDWHYLGDIIFQNTLENVSQLHSFEMKLRFPQTDIGPVSNFYIRMLQEDGPFESEQLFSLTGTAFFGGIDQNIKTGEYLRFSVYIKPKSDEMFFMGEGTGSVSVYKATGSMYSSFVSSSKETYGHSFAPVYIETRDLTPFFFTPRIEE